MTETLFEHNVSLSVFSTRDSGFMRESEVFNMSHYDLWHVAMKKEMDSFERHQVWDIVERGMTKPLRSRWVLGLKNTSAGVVLKARFVICGNLQIEHVDYDETLAPTPPKDSLRLLLCVVPSRRLVLHQLDVHSAFLHGMIDREVFVELPSFVFSCEMRSGKVGKIRRSVYGLKQSPLI
jgi:Reverse transcriptase (RNA-dependent DNA polymerase)